MTSKSSNSAATGGAATLAVVLLRLAVGGTFVLSGLAKAIDPWGGLYKIKDYLNALGLSGWTDMALFGSFVLSAVELLLGVLLVVGAYRRAVPLLTMLFMLVMTPLTVWLAVTNAVPDCGCFGDALHLSNAATLGKNVLLLAGALALVVLGRRVRGLYGPAVQWAVAAVTLAATAAVAATGYFTQPPVDFRPYPVGTTLRGETAPASYTDFLFVYEKDGVQREFTIDSLPDEEQGWEYVDRRPAQPQHGTVVERHAQRLALYDNGMDMTDDVLAADTVLLILMPDIEEVSVAQSFDINDLADYARRHGAEVYGATPAGARAVEWWRDISMANYPILAADDGEVKMLARGNPAVVLIAGGRVAWKRTLTSLSADRMHDPAVSLGTLADDYNPRATLRGILAAWLAAMAVLLILNRTHVALSALLRLGKKRDTGHEPQPAATNDDNQNV